MLNRRFGLIFLFFPLWGCTGPEQQGKDEPVTGNWRVEMDINGHPLPFVMDLLKKGSEWSVIVENGEERIAVDDIRFSGDSIFIRMPLYDSEFKGLYRNGEILGHWYNHLKGPSYKIPFKASVGEQERFDTSIPPAKDVSGTWEVHFSEGEEKAYNAIGVFEQLEDGLTHGTFITETGDYRFLEGRVQGDSLKLSSFDGSHAFLFTAAISDTGMEGQFWSGTHWKEPWRAVRNPDFALRNPDSLTFLREGHTMVDFKFPDLNGDLVSPSDPRFKGKPLMIQVMGSWCSNCVDETRLLNEFYQEYNDRGLEVIALAFEKYEDTTKAIAGLKRYRDVLGVPYPILYGGMANKEVAMTKLPFLDHMMSYPTCIIVDHTGKVRRIHTGYYGPGTGAHHTAFRRELRSFLERLLLEHSFATVELHQKRSGK